MTDLITRNANDCLCTLYGTITAIDTDAGTADVSLDIGGSLSGVEFHYNCTDKTKTYGPRAFNVNDEIKMVSVNDGTGYSLSNTVIIGFKDGNRRYCGAGVCICSEGLSASYGYDPDGEGPFAWRIFPSIDFSGETFQKAIYSNIWNYSGNVYACGESGWPSELIELAVTSSFFYQWDTSVDCPSISDPLEHLIWEVIYNYRAFSIAIMPNTRFRMYGPDEPVVDDPTEGQMAASLYIDETGPKILNFCPDTDTFYTNLVTDTYNNGLQIIKDNFPLLFPYSDGWDNPYQWVNDPTFDGNPSAGENYFPTSYYGKIVIEKI